MLHTSKRLLLIGDHAGLLQIAESCLSFVQFLGVPELCKSAAVLLAKLAPDTIQQCGRAILEVRQQQRGVLSSHDFIALERAARELNAYGWELLQISPVHATSKLLGAATTAGTSLLPPPAPPPPPPHTATTYRDGATQPHDDSLVSKSWARQRQPAQRLVPSDVSSEKEVLLQLHKMKLTCKAMQKVIAVEWSYADDGRLAMADQTGCVNLVNVTHDEFEHRGSFAGTSLLNALALHPVQDAILTGGMQNVVSLYRRASSDTQGSWHANWLGHTSPITSLAWQDERAFVSSGGDGFVRLWDSNSAESVRVFEAPPTNADGSTPSCLQISFASSDPARKTFVACMPNAICLWDVRVASPVSTFELPSGIESLNACVISPLGISIAAGGNGATVYLYDVRSRRLAAQFGDGHEAKRAIFSIAFGCSATNVYTGHADGNIRTWDVFDRQWCTSELAAHVDAQMNITQSRVTKLSVAPNGSMLASGGFDGTVRIWAPQYTHITPQSLPEHLLDSVDGMDAASVDIETNNDLLRRQQEFLTAKMSRDLDAKLKTSRRQSEQANARTTHAMLLGVHEAGKSTLFKQWQLMSASFTDDEKKMMKAISIARSNIFSSMLTLLAGFEKLGVPMPEDVARLAARLPGFEEGGRGVKSDQIAVIAALWAHPAVRGIWAHRSQFQLNDSAGYMLCEAPRILSDHYHPSDEDVVRMRIRTAAVLTSLLNIHGRRVHFYEMGSLRNQNQRLIHLMQFVDIIIFVVPLSAYTNTAAFDQVFELFEKIVHSTWLFDLPVLILLNKADLLRESLLSMPFAEHYAPAQGKLPPKASLDDCCKYVTSRLLAMNPNPCRRVTVRIISAVDAASVSKASQALLPPPAVLEQPLVTMKRLLLRKKYELARTEVFFNALKVRDTPERALHDAAGWN